MPTPYPPASPQPDQEPVRPRLTLKTAAALVAGLVAILLVSGAITVWASNTGPRAAMPAAWTAGPSGPADTATHPSVPVATGNRASTPAPPSASRTGSANTPTSPPSSTSTAKATSNQSMAPCSAGQTISTAVFSLKVPQGWKCFEQTTGGSQPLISIYDESLDVIQVGVNPSKDVPTACGSYLTSTGASTVVAAQDTIWGGKTAKTVKVTVSTVTGQIRCVESKGVIYMMAGGVAKGTYDGVAASMSAVATAWVWK